MYLLDTDHISILQRESASEFKHLIARMANYEPGNFLVAIVSFHEQVTGWSAYVKRAKSPEAVVRAYEMFERVLSDFSAMTLAPFDDQAARTFELLRQSKIRIGTMDLRIAAIALVQGFTVLSRNLVDFQLVPKLRIEDWTLPSSTEDFVN